MPAPSPHRRGAAALTVALTVALTAALALAPLPGGGDAAGVAASQAAGTATGRTAVTVVVRRCRSCTIQPVRYVPSEGADPWWGPVRHLDSARQVTLHLPTARTHGLTFFVDAPWHGADDVAALAALRYRGRSPGDAVTAADARTTHRATPCWAGTDQPAARIVIRVDRFPTRTAFTGQRTHHPRAYAPRTLETWPPMARAYRGSLGAQDAYACTPPAPPEPPGARRGRRAGAVTRLVVRTRGCAACQLTLAQWTSVTRRPWRTGTRTVQHGRARFTIPTRRTHGLQIAVTAPWRGVTGDQTFAVLRYGGHPPGSTVGFRTARQQHLGSACWAGTDARRATLRLAVRRVRVYAPISDTRVPGELAWTPRQHRTWNPMREVAHGVYGSEELTVCTAP
ncbi:hypothetical protein KM427_09420 [Nocardioides sp. LMS-CY]|uniref:Uncharacterized protein n=1 Tax=Nocardioides soli TaxID=1036020 RepID=A0A7W4VSG7_9ACTN|nr:MULTISPECIES: hypothetical protein [Nocardioides]MBB3040663.1 hypothetical protein [Nocardioides soli]QWF23880.1 hypothetical protein KM427_09420 [Nocardioides sp. LMS-CY]